MQQPIHRSFRRSLNRVAMAVGSAGIAMSLALSGCATGESPTDPQTQAVTQTEQRVYSLRDAILDDGPDAIIAEEHRDVVLEIQSLEFSEAQREALGTFEEVHLAPRGLTSEDLLEDPDTHAALMLADPALRSVLAQIQDSMGLHAPAEDETHRAGALCAVAVLVAAVGLTILGWKWIDGYNANAFCSACRDDAYRQCGPTSAGVEAVVQCETGTNADVNLGGGFKNESDVQNGTYSRVGDVAGSWGNGGNYACAYQCNIFAE